MGDEVVNRKQMGRAGDPACVVERLRIELVLMIRVVTREPMAQEVSQRAA